MAPAPSSPGVPTAGPRHSRRKNPYLPQPDTSAAWIAAGAIYTIAVGTVVSFFGRSFNVMFIPVLWAVAAMAAYAATTHTKHVASNPAALTVIVVAALTIVVALGITATVLLIRVTGWS